MLRGVVFALCVAGAATALADAPRYRFRLGQEVQFAGTKKSWVGEKPSESKSSWRLWVTQVNQDESVGLVVEAEPDADAKYLVQMTVYPDGRIPWNATMEVLPAWLSVRRLLPILPSDEELLKSEWTHTESRTGVRWDYRCERNSDTLAISAKCRGPLELVSVGEMAYTWTFDTTKGSIAGSVAQGAWADYKERDEEQLALTATIQHDVESTSLFRDETQDYFKTVQEYRSRFMPHDWARLVRSTATVGTDNQKEQGRALLERRINRSTEALVGVHYRKLLQDHDKRGDWIKSSLKEYENIVDKESPEWTADDLEGKLHGLAEYLGKVVVLDFWFRKCNYCIRAQPQFDLVIEHFKDKPVQFLGMNVDENIEDAKFAVSKLHPTYPTLQGKKAQEQYGIGGAPIWLILDQHGVVRSVHVGYSGRLQEELTESINNLLTSASTDDSQTNAAPAFTEEEVGRQKQQSHDNLKAIMLAMHNYHDKIGSFPPPILYGKDGKGGKHAHSWRVALLPYLDQTTLYEKYEFDEAWDSESNKHILAQMPSVFRAPVADQKSVNAACFVLVGKMMDDDNDPPSLQTLFSSKSGVKLQKVLDGSSQTLAVFETKRDIPWTKPEDIAYDPTAKLPKIGGFYKDGFYSGVGDGQIRFISNTVEVPFMKALISPAGGEIIEF